jgi:hypothetical protein
MIVVQSHISTLINFLSFQTTIESGINVHPHMTKLGEKYSCCTHIKINIYIVLPHTCLKYKFVIE